MLERGVRALRKRMLEQAELVARGGEPKAVIRDPAANACVQLPIIGREYFVGGYSRTDGDERRGRTPGSPPRKDFPFLTGQPEEIRQAFRRAMVSMPKCRATFARPAKLPRVPPSGCRQILVHIRPRIGASFRSAANPGGATIG